MTLVYIDTIAGASGDMLLGALLGAGVGLSDLQACLARLDVPEYEIAVRSENRFGLTVTRAEVRLTAPSPSHRHLPDILGLIDRADLPGQAAEWAKAVFHRLAEAEARVHGTTPEKVHFHEVGAVDSIVDIVGVCTGLALLGADRVEAGPPPLGSGYIHAAHGRLPVPAPAVVELVRGIPTAATDETGELTTPTGAALLVTLADRFGPMPAMVIRSVGYGAGAREGTRGPNVVRVIVGEACDAAGGTGPTDTVLLLEANIDDATGETLGAASRALLAAGALDVWLTPVTMKKGRPGVVLGCLVGENALGAVEKTIFHQTTTFGVRRTRVDRTKLERDHVEVETPFGPVRVKVGRLAGRVVTALPEYDDCLQLAEEQGVAFREVYDAARTAYETTSRPGAGDESC